jgi:hypothetical protein
MTTTRRSPLTLRHLAACCLVVAACRGSSAKPDAGRPSDGATFETSAKTDAPGAQPDATASETSPTPDAAASETSATSDAAGAETSGARDAAADGPGGAQSSLAQLVARDWTGNGEAGNCINIKSWYSFGADGTAVNRDIDENACSRKNVLRAKSVGRYTLTDHVLEMTLDGIGLDQTYLVMEPPKVPVANRLEHFPVVAGVIAPPWIGAGRLALDRDAYTGTDGAHFQSDRYARLESATGARLFEQKALFSITVDPPLPLAAGTSCQVDVDLALTSFDAAATPTTENGTFHVRYMAIVRNTEEGWMRLVPKVVDGLANDAASTAWTGVLDASDLSEHTPRFRQVFNLGFSYYLGHQVGDTQALSQSLPQTARWTEATKPPPVQ